MSEKTICIPREAIEKGANEMTNPTHIIVPIQAIREHVLYDGTWIDGKRIADFGGKEYEAETDDLIVEAICKDFAQAEGMPSPVNNETVARAIIEELQSIGNFDEFSNHRREDGIDTMCVNAIAKVLDDNYSPATEVSLDSSLSEVARLKGETTATRELLTNLLQTCAPESEPLDALAGLVSQVDNYIAGLKNQSRILRETLDTLLAYNESILAGRINYRAVDHIKVANQGLRRAAEAMKGEKEND